MNIEATVRKVNTVQNITDTFQKRTMIATVDPSSKFPAHLTFDATGTKIDLLDDLSPGDKVNIHYNLNGRLAKDKQGEEMSFNSLSIWKIDVLEKSQTKPQGASMPPPPNM